MFLSLLGVVVHFLSAVSVYFKSTSLNFTLARVLKFLTITVTSSFYNSFKLSHTKSHHSLDLLDEEVDIQLDTRHGAMACGDLVQQIAVRLVHVTAGLREGRGGGGEQRV